MWGLISVQLKSSPGAGDVSYSLTANSLASLM